MQAVNTHGEGPLSDIMVGQTKEAGERRGEERLEGLNSGHRKTLLINFPPWLAVRSAVLTELQQKLAPWTLAGIIPLVVHPVKHNLCKIHLIDQWCVVVRCGVSVSVGCVRM